MDKSRTKMCGFSIPFNSLSAPPQLLFNLHQAVVFGRAVRAAGRAGFDSATV